MDLPAPEPLLPLIQRLCVQRRRPGEPPFRLASGAESDVYVDMRRLALDPVGVWSYAHAALNATLGVAPDLVAGVELGGCPLATAYSLTTLVSSFWQMLVGARRLSGGIIPAIYVRKEDKGHGSGKRIAGNYQRGQTVLLLEDVVTSGASTLRAIDALRQAGLNPICFLAVADREEGGLERVHDAGVPARALFSLSELLDKDPVSEPLPHDDTVCDRCGSPLTFHGCVQPGCDGKDGPDGWP